MTVINDRVAFLPVPAVQFHAAAALQQHLRTKTGNTTSSSSTTTTTTTLSSTTTTTTTTHLQPARKRTNYAQEKNGFTHTFGEKK